MPPFAKSHNAFIGLQGDLREDLGRRSNEQILQMGSRLGLRLAMLLYPLRLASTGELRWFIAHHDALHSFRDTAPPLLREAFIEEKGWTTE